MASTKKKTSSNKKKSTTKKKVSSSTSTKTTSKKKVSTTKKGNTAKKGVSSVKKTNSKKPTIKVNIEEPKKVEIEKKVELPNLKTPIKEVSKNKNTPKKVVKEEIFKKSDVVNKSKPIKGKKRKRKSNAKIIASIKKSNFIKKYNKVRRKIKMYGITSVVPKKYIFGSILAVILLLILIITFNIIFQKNNKLDIEGIPNKIDSLKTVSFNIDDVPDIISTSKAFDNLKDYYEYDFKEVFYLDSSYVDDYSIKYNKSKKQSFIVIKASDNNGDNVKEAIEKFFKENKIKDYLSLEYQGYQIFIKSKSEDGDKIVKSKIMQSQIRVFNPLRELKKDEIEKTLKISDSYYSEFLVKTAMIIKSDVCGYVIFKPVNTSAKEKIMNLMEDYFAGLEAKWINNKDNLELIKNRKFEEYQGYLIYIVSRNNDLVLDFIKN